MNRLLAIPIVCAIIAATGMFLDTPATFYRGLLIAAAAATAISAFVTTGAFSPGDKLFSAWLLIGCGYALAAIRYAFSIYGLITNTQLLARPVLNAMLILQNVLIAVSLWLFVRSWRTTGLATPVSRGSSIAWTVVGIAVALVVGGYPLIEGFATRNADTVLLISTLGDVVGIALIVPLLMPALAMRGGLLMHTWIFLALCEAFWLAYDIWLAFRTSAGIAPRIGTGVEQMIRVAAITFALVATIAQRRAVRPMMAIPRTAEATA